MQCEAQLDDIYEFPPELLDFALFSCVCPVFVPSAEQLNIYKGFIGHKCKCEVGKCCSQWLILYSRELGSLTLYDDVVLMSEPEQEQRSSCDDYTACSLANARRYR